MKKIILILVFFQFIVGFAQRPTGFRTPQGGNNQRSVSPKTQKFEASKFAGIIDYDAKKVFKKLKIKKSDSIADKTTRAIEVFNAQIKKISITNKDLFEGLNVVINQNIEAALKNKDREATRSSIELAREKLMPVKIQIAEHETILNLALNTILNKTQYKKWLDYQKTKKEKLKPKEKKQIDARDRPSKKTRGNANQRIGF